MNAPTTVALVEDRRKFFIGGEWVDPQGDEVFSLQEAATGAHLADCALGNASDIDAAVRAARQAQDHGAWAEASVSERVMWIHGFSKALKARGRQTAELVSRENGMPIGFSSIYNGSAPASLLRYYADMMAAYPLEDVRKSFKGSTIVRAEPVGVVGAIAPWNYPQVLAMFKIAPALAAGCTLVLKPSPETALDAFAFAEAAEEAGLPPGVLNIVPADRSAGAALVSHPLVDKIGFTGSSEAGRIIGAECGRLLRPCTLELGGKSAAIFCEDGDIDVFFAGLGDASFQNSSQTCTTQSRILAPRRRYAEVVEAVAAYCRGLRTGNPLDPQTTCGPMATERHMQRVMSYIDIGRASGARLVTGGGRPAGLDQGWFVEPTVFADLDNDHRLAREEIFGPVIVVIPYDSEEDAIRIANDSNFGLAGSVWSADEDRALAIARRIRTGTIGLNYYFIDTGAPFGGMKDSGLGRELGPEGLKSYMEFKSIYASNAYLPA